MKSFLTFTLAAGVAITTTSVAHAQSPTMGRFKIDQDSVSKQVPAAQGARTGLFLDRAALTRELNKLRLDVDLVNGDELETSYVNVAPRKKSTVVWTGG